MSGGPAARPRSCATRGSSIGKLNASTSLVTSHGQRHCAQDKGVGVIRAWASSRRGWDAWHGPHRLVGAHDQRFFEVGAGKRDRGTAARAVRRYDHCGHARRARPHRALVAVIRAVGPISPVNAWQPSQPRRKQANRHAIQHTTSCIPCIGHSYCSGRRTGLRFMLAVVFSQFSDL